MLEEMTFAMGGGTQQMQYWHLALILKLNMGLVVSLCKHSEAKNCKHVS